PYTDSGTAAILVQGKIRMGKIISMDAASVTFDYIGDTGSLAGLDARVDLLMHDSDVYIENIAAHIEKDRIVARGIAPEDQTVRRCVARFIQPEPSQKEQINRQVKSHTRREIARRRHLSKEIQKSEEKYKTILESIEEGYFEVDISGHVTFFNSSMRRMIGYSEKELLGMGYRKFMSDDTAARVFRAYNRAFKTGRLPTPFDWELVRKGGDRVYVETSLSFIKNADDRIVGFRGIARDVSSRKRLEQELLHMASHDHLTGLYNRGALFEKLRETIAYAKRFHQRCALLFLDLDNFKTVNDTWGHETGDRVLKEAAARLTALLRETDYVCRHGGDEFTIILSNSENMNPPRVAQKVIDAISRPYHVGGHDISVITTSVGISVYPDDSDTMDRLVRCADKAMYKAKDRKNRYICYNRGKYTKKLPLDH
ncbi:MAG: diguanylate cyclase, partial [Thermodesulfobacteriota bacterium]